MRHFFARANRHFLGASVLALACLSAAAPALADDYSEISRLLRAGQLSEPIPRSISCWLPNRKTHKSAFSKA